MQNLNLETLDLEVKMIDIITIYDHKNKIQNKQTEIIICYRVFVKL